MASISVDDMRYLIAKVYDSATWRYKVNHVMSDNQVIAIYYSFCESGKFNQNLPVKKKKKEIPKDKTWNYNSSDSKIYEGIQLRFDI